MTEGVLGAGARRGRHRERLPEVGPFQARCEAERLRVGGAGGGRRGGGQGRRQPCRSQGAEKVLRRCPSNALRWGAAVGAKARRGSHTPGEEGQAGKITPGSSGVPWGGYAARVCQTLARSHRSDQPTPLTKGTAILARRGGCAVPPYCHPYLHPSRQQQREGRYPQKKLLEATVPADMSSCPKRWLWGDAEPVTLTRGCGRAGGVGACAHGPQGAPALAGSREGRVQE